MKETKTLEYKETVTNTFLKTVSAYANYGTGVILFGIDDKGMIKGIKDPEQTCLDIENRINDNIDPIPEYTLSIDQKTSVITLTVYEGIHKPYLYKAKAYRRNDTATIAADRLELTRLILEGENLTFEEIASDNQNLSFSVLEERLKAVLNLQQISLDTLKTLELYKDGSGYNHAAELLADRNNFNGIDLVRFGDSISIILDHETYEHESILLQYDHAVDLYKKYYQYEEIKGSTREKVSLIPEEAFREAIANAIVHRTWDVKANINTAMFPDRIEITSPGGLPKGLNEDEYYRGGISILRNRIIGNVFFRLHMIERFGTGIRRIIESYKNSVVKPIFSVTENTIKIVLPVFETNHSLSPDENLIYTTIRDRFMSSSAISDATGFGRTKTISILKNLAGKGVIRSIGNGRGRKYSAD